MQVLDIAGPVGILDEHPEWSARLICELERRGLPWEKIDHSSHAYDPRDRTRRFSVIANRTSPSSHTRGHSAVLFYAEVLLAHYESLGIPVINPVAAYRFEKSKALQVGLFERLGVRYPRALVANDRARIAAAAQRLRFPVVVKPNVGGSGAGIVRFESRADLEARLATLDLGPDHTVLVQEYVEPRDGAIVRVEVLDGRALYAIRIVRSTGRFNLCPADICQTPPPTTASACPVDAAPAVRLHGGTIEAPQAPLLGAPRGVRGRTRQSRGAPRSPDPALSVARVDAPAEAVEAAIRLARAASIDVGGIEYLAGKDDGRIYFYDVNATSNFVANAPEVLGFDPFVPFVDFIVQRAMAPYVEPPAAARRRRPARVAVGGG